jgi:hypothetical protein
MKKFSFFTQKLPNDFIRSLSLFSEYSSLALLVCDERERRRQKNFLTGSAVSAGKCMRKKNGCG